MRFGTRVAVVAVYGMSLALIAPAAIADGPEIMRVEGGDTTLPGNFSGSILVIGSDLTLDCAGHEIQGPGYDLGGGDIQAGVVVEGWTTGVTVENCVISGFDTSSGIVVGGTDTTVKSNVVDDSQIGISVFTDDNTIVGNTVTNSTFDGFLLRGDEFGDPVSGNLVLGNHAEDNVSNFSLEFADNNTLRGNTAVGSGLGYQIAFAHDNVFQGNTATGSQAAFEFIPPATGNTLRGNRAWDTLLNAFNLQCTVDDDGLINGPCADSNVLIGNLAHGSGNTGFFVIGSDNRLAGNQAIDNHTNGYTVGWGARNVVDKNAAYGNGLFGFITFGMQGASPGGEDLPFDPGDQNFFGRNTACDNNQQGTDFATDFGATVNSDPTLDRNSFCTTTTLGG